MQNTSNNIIVWILTILLFIVSCTSTTPTTDIATIESTREIDTQDDHSVYGFLANHDQYSKFVLLLEVAGLEETIQEMDSITVFAVTDNVFEKLPDDMLEVLLNDEENLRYIMSRHIVVGDLTGASLRQGDTVCDDISTFETLAGDALQYGLDSDKQLTVDEIPVIRTDIGADNGQIHLLSSPLFPRQSPLRPKNVLESIPSEGFKYIRNALWNIGGPHDIFCPEPDLPKRLRQDGPYTLFVPTDEAFLAFEASHHTQLQDIPTLTKFVPYHFLEDVAFDTSSSRLRTNQTFTGEEIEVAFSDSDNLIINDQPVKVIQKIEAQNGIVYFIDSVIVPPSIIVEDLPAKSIWDVLQDDGRLNSISHLFRNSRVEGIDGYLFSAAFQTWGPYTVIAPTNEAAEILNPYILRRLIFKDILPIDSPELASFTIMETIDATNGVIYVVDELPE